MRTFADQAEYYACIVESAERLLADDPHDTLTSEVTANISGGHSSWDNGATKIFEHPADVKEALVGLELRTVLEIAVENQLQEVRRLSRKEPVNLGLFGIPMDFGLLVSSATNLAKRNVMAALRTKVEMAEIARRCDKLSLADFLTTYCVIEGVDGDEFCGQF